ncbi:MAG: Fic family protein [Methylococcales bacterium]
MTLTAILHNIDQLKIELDTLRPLESESVCHALDIEYTYESNRIEGNTLTLCETALVIDKGLTVSGKSMREHLEAISHYQAVLMLKEFVRDQTPLTEGLIKQFHALILQSIDAKNAGVYRHEPVMISGSLHIPPAHFLVPEQMEKCLAWFAQHQQHLHPVLLAAEMHEQIVSIHPFEDGNGRTSRLIMNLLLMQHGYYIANLSGDIDSRRRYYEALELCNTTGDKTEFLLLIAEQVKNGMARLIRIAKGT